MSEEPSTTTPAHDDPEVLAAKAKAAQQANGKKGDPTSILRELEAKLAAALEETAAKERASKSLQGDVAALKASSQEVGKAAEQYTKARPELEKKRNERNDYIESRRSLIEGAIGDKRKAADDAWDKEDKEVSDLQKGLETATATLAAARIAHEEKTRAQAAAEAGFRAALEGARAIQATANEQLASLEQLRKAIEADEDAGYAPGMYIRMREYDRILEDTGRLLIADTELGATLDTAWLQLQTAQDELRTAAEDAAKAQETFDKSKKAFEERQTSRVANVLAKLPPKKP